MPYEWQPTDAPDEQRLHLWPYRSLPRRGFVWFIGATCALILLPMLSVLGSPVLWGILPFFVVAVAGMWFALSRSYRDGEIVEDLLLTRDAIRLVRHGPRGRRQDWEANPYWVRVTLHRTGGPVPNYLTLKGDGREVELGAFLSEEERVALKDDVEARLSRMR